MRLVFSGTRLPEYRWPSDPEEDLLYRSVGAALIILPTQTAIANVEAIGPVGGKPYEAQLNGGNEKFLLELKRRVEGAGFGDVEILSSMFVVTAKSSSGRDLALIVDSDTQALQIGSDEVAEASHAKPLLKLCGVCGEKSSEAKTRRSQSALNAP
jgi:hypothetical protein